MGLGQNPFNPSRTLPTLAAIQQRHRELPAYQARQEAAQALATPNEDETSVPEEVHVTQEQEEQQENDELQEPYAEGESEPSVVLPLRSSAPPPLALDAAAFNGGTHTAPPPAVPKLRSSASAPSMPLLIATHSSMPAMSRPPWRYGIIVSPAPASSSTPHPSIPPPSASASPRRHT
jgi:hypothetical protein